jgi:hypothetical protein
VAVLVGILAYLVKQTHFWLWTIFALDYFLGNPSSLNNYRWQLLSDAQKEWPIKMGHRIPPNPLPQLYGENYTHAAFKAITESYTRPVVIRGLFKDAPAMQWTPEYLATNIGDERLFTAFIDNGIGSNKKGTFLTTVPSVVKNVTAGGNNYLFNSNFEYPTDIKLVKEIDIDRLKWRPAILIQFFLGLAREWEAKWRGSPMHAAVAPNINVQLSGRKHWVMIDPKYYAYVKPTLLSDQVAVFVGGGLDYGEVDRWHNFPRFDDIVNPGDAIYIPPWWMHEVQNLQGPEWQISLALRFPDLRSSLWNGWFFTSLVDLGTRNKPCLPGFRMLCAEFLANWEGTQQKIAPAAIEATKRFSEDPPATNNYE